MSKSDNSPTSQSYTLRPHSPAPTGSPTTLPIAPTTPSLVELLARSHQRVVPMIEGTALPRAPRSVPLTRAEKRQLMIRVFSEALSIANDINNNNDNEELPGDDDFETLFPLP